MIKVGPALLEHAEQLERERGIPRDVVLSSLKEAMLAAYKRFAHLTEIEGYECKLIERTGEIGIFEQKTVVEDPEAIDPEEQPGLHPIDLKEARTLKVDAEIGEVIEIDVTPEDFGRIAAQSAKQVITQRIREAEKMLVLKEFEDKRHTITTGVVQRIEGRNVIINIGRNEAVMPPREQLPGEYYRVGNKLRVFVADVRDNGRVPQIIVSQAHPAMVREVFELEVPEIEDGLVEIKNIAREAGYRTKVAVTSNDPDVDPQGACIGARGSRIQAIVSELKNEKIDIIRWSETPSEFITHALAPAKIIRVEVNADAETPRALVVVPDDQLSLAIGREGQNVRLAAKLTGFKLDIKSISQVQTELEAAQENLLAETMLDSSEVAPLETAEETTLLAIEPEEAPVTEEAAAATEEEIQA